MNKEQIVQQVMNELQSRANAGTAASEMPKADAPVAGTYGVDPTGGGLTEFVGVQPKGDTIGLVIANLDPSLHKAMGFDPKYRSLGIVSSRSGAGPQAMAGDEAVKSCNVELLLFEMSNDTKGNGGHGSILIFGAEDVSDARRAVEVVLDALNWTFGGVHGNANSFIECQYSARASHVLADHLHGEYGKAFGLLDACPASIGVLMVDAALKAADVKMTTYGCTDSGDNVAYTNEFMAFFTGDSGAVKQAIIAGREVGLKLLRAMGDEPVPTGDVYF